MKKFYFWFAASLFFIILVQNSTIISAQISVSSIAEYQLGNLPAEDPSNLTSLYDQLQLEYYNDNLIIGLRYETFNSSNLNRKYNIFSQRYLEWQKDWFRLRIGNFYGMLGRGLVFRAFELPGIIQEDQTNRVRYGLTRDADGFIVETDWNFFQMTLLRGESLNSTIPLTYDNDLRSLGIVEGGQIKIIPKHWFTIGATYVRYVPTNVPPFEAGSGFIRLSLEPILELISNDLLIDFYGEYAQKQAGKDNFLTLSDKYSHALYLSANFIFKNFGLSLEHKDYHDFNLQMNYPPPSVRQHSFYLLNRETHVLLPEDEKGNQFEATYAFRNGTTFIANYTCGENRPLFLERTIFEEKFFEADVDLSENILTKVFVDQSKDEYFSKLIDNRITGGVTLDCQFDDRYSVNFDIQAQKTEKMFEFAPNKNKYNHFYGSIGLTKSPKFSVALELQYTDDPEITDIPLTSDNLESEPKKLWAINTNYQISNRHEVFLFYGERPGGWACTAGTCYPVLAFKGLEIRLISRL